MRCVIWVVERSPGGGPAVAIGWTASLAPGAGSNANCAAADRWPASCVPTKLSPVSCGLADQPAVTW
jgi:hypothetical protein